ncbi:MAG: hypothetical protein NWE98_02135 [Candidatus Bathyarchaeota archaeon]|nr:hypothetical protein [Candidatus Bathyarchaeota archaeon]
MDKTTKILTAASLILVVASPIVWWTINYDIRTYELTGKVKEKTFALDGDSVTYVVVLTDNRTLEIKSNFWHNVNEDLVYSSIEANRNYTFHCWGLQLTVPMLGIYVYPNIIEASPIQ